MIRAGRLQTDKRKDENEKQTRLSLLLTQFLWNPPPLTVLPTVHGLGVTFTATMTAEYKGPYSLSSCIILVKKGSGFTLASVRLSAPPLWVCSQPQALITQLSEWTLKAGACKKTELRREQQRRGHIQRDGGVFQGSLSSAHREGGSARFHARI